jgi:hypothetical protein
VAPEATASVVRTQHATLSIYLVATRGDQAQHSQKPPEAKKNGSPSGDELPLLLLIQTG